MFQAVIGEEKKWLVLRRIANVVQKPVNFDTTV
jgi:hypothetical protein